MFTCNRSTLLKALAPLAGMKRKGMNIVQPLFLRPGTNYISFGTADGTMTVFERVDGDGTLVEAALLQSGGADVQGPFELVHEFLKGVGDTDAPVTFALLPSPAGGGKLAITCGSKNKCEVAVAPSDTSWATPIHNLVGGTADVVRAKVGVLYRALQVVFACSSEETRPALTAVCCAVSPADNRVVTAATDGFRLAEHTLTLDAAVFGGDQPATYLLPSTAVLRLLKLLKALDPDLEVQVCTGQAGFSARKPAPVVPVQAAMPTADTLEDTDPDALAEADEGDEDDELDPVTAAVRGLVGKPTPAAKAVQAAAPAATPAAKSVAYQSVAGALVLRWPGGEAVTNLVEGKFPDYSSIVPKQHTTVLVYDRAGWVRDLQTAGLFAKDAANQVVLEVADGQTKTTAQAAEVGQTIILTPHQREGNEVTVSFNVRFLLAGAVAAGEISGEPKVRLELTKDDRPGVVRAGNFLYVCMPMQLPKKPTGEKKAAAAAAAA